MKRPSDFELAYYVENHLRNKHAAKVDEGLNEHVTDNFQTWLSDPSRFDFRGVDTIDKRNPPKGYSKHLPEIRHYLEKNYGGLLHDTYWNRAKKGNGY